MCALGTPVILKCNSAQQAEAYRGRLYAFRRAIRNEPSFDLELTLVEPVMKLSLDGHNLIIDNKEPLDAENTKERPGA